MRGCGARFCFTPEVGASGDSLEGFVYLSFLFALVSILEDYLSFTGGWWEISSVRMMP